MKKIIGITVVMMLLLVGCANGATTDKDKETEVKQAIKVAVSIPPQATMVKAIGGDLIEVVTMIPPGYSPANYAPTQKEMAALSDSQLYFGIDVPTEVVNIMPMIEGSGYDIKVIDLAIAVDNRYPARYFGESDHEGEDHEDHEGEDHEGEHAHDHDHAGRDPHIWLSVKRIEVMVNEMEKELSKLSPENAEMFKGNRDDYIEELRGVDSDLQEMFKDFEHRSFLIYHPSLGYFAEAYGLEMMPLESEGKTATVQGMTSVIEYAKEHSIQTVFYQEEFDSKQAELLADEIGGTAVQLSPLDENVVDNLKEMGTLIRNSFE